MKEEFKKAAEKRVEQYSSDMTEALAEVSKKSMDTAAKSFKVRKFSREMSKELRNNEDKGNWEDFTEVDEIISELNYHIDKLYAKVYDVNRGSKPKEELKEHIADCANILLFLGNAYGLYDK